MVPPWRSATCGCSCVRSCRLPCARIHAILPRDVPKRMGSRRRKNILFFPGKVVAAGDERQLACASGAGALVLSDVFGSYMVFCNVRLRSYRMFWNLWLQIAARWQHDCCHPLPCAFIHAILPRDVAQRIVMAA